MNQQPYNVSAVFILSFLLREVTYSISSNQCTVVDMPWCIASRYVHRNKQEAYEHTLVHDCTLKEMEIDFLATLQKI